MRTPKRTFNSR